MADNTLALLHHFTGPSSPLSSIRLTTPHKPRIVYFSILGTWFFAYSHATATALSATLLVASLALFWEISLVTPNINFVKLHLRGLRNLLSGLMGALLGANVVAFLMTAVLGKALSWFSREWLPLVLYAPPAIAGAEVLHSTYVNHTQPIVLGALAPQLFFFHPAHQDESPTLFSALLLYSLLAMILQSVFELGSSSFLFLLAAPLLLALALNAAQTKHFEDVLLRTYMIAGVVPVVLGTEMWCGIADVFVPLVWCHFVHPDSRFLKKYSSDRPHGGGG